MGEGIRLWDMRKLGKPVRQLIWDNSSMMSEEEKQYYVNPTINCDFQACVDCVVSFFDHERHPKPMMIM